MTRRSARSVSLHREESSPFDQTGESLPSSIGHQSEWNLDDALSRDPHADADACGRHGRRMRREPSHPERASDSAEPATSAPGADHSQIRDVIRRFNQASLAGDTSAMCSLVDPARLSYLEQIGQPCEVSLGGTLTPEAQRDVRSSTITTIEITGDNAVAHTRGESGTRDLRLHRTQGHWLILGV